MISQLLTSISRVRKGALQITALLGLLGLAAVSSSHAAVVGIDPSTVVPSDTFSFRVVGYNTSAPAQNIYLTNPADFTFGTTNSYPGYALNGQALTVSSTEYLNNGVITDFLFFSVPSNYVPSGTRDNGGNVINALQFSIGNYLGGNNPLNFNPALSSYSVTGSVNFTNTNGQPASGAVPMTTSLTSNGTALSTFGALVGTASQSNPSGDLSPSMINGFSITISYAVPEPSTWAMFALGTAGLFMVVVRRRHSARL